MSQLWVVLEIDSELVHTTGSARASGCHINDHTIGTISSCCTSTCSAVIVTLEDRRGEENICDHRDAHGHIQEMAVVILARAVNECLKLGNVVGVGEVNHINSDVVLTQTLTKALVFFLLFQERMSTEDDDSRLSILVHSVLQR